MDKKLPSEEGSVASHGRDCLNSTGYATRDLSIPFQQNGESRMHDKLWPAGKLEKRLKEAENDCKGANESFCASFVA